MPELWRSIGVAREPDRRVRPGTWRSHGVVREPDRRVLPELWRSIGVARADSTKVLAQGRGALSLLGRRLGGWAGRVQSRWAGGFGAGGCEPGRWLFFLQGQGGGGFATRSAEDCEWGCRELVRAMSEARAMEARGVLQRGVGQPGCSALMLKGSVAPRSPLGPERLTSASGLSTAGLIFECGVSGVVCHTLRLFRSF